MPNISKCLPEVKTVASEPSHILSEAMMHVLSFYLPGGIRLSKWKLLYTPTEHGYSHLTFFDRLGGAGETILVIKDIKGSVFGAFATEQWKNTSYFYGDGYSFVFSFRRGDDLELYPATGCNDLYQQSDEDGIIIGGSDDSSQRSSITISH